VARITALGRMNKELKASPHPLRRFVAFLRGEGEAGLARREDPGVLLATQITYSALSLQFLLILALAGTIASLGLMADSAVAIVGAMLIAPLMRPILAIAYGVVTGRRTLLSRAFMTLLIGVLVTVLIAWLTEQILGLREPTREIMARTRPSMIDLGVAVAAGIAAGLASIRRNIADTLPGVAIAVALVPPLCVLGITLSIGAFDQAWGAALLFAVNLVAIVLCAVVVFLIDGHGLLRHAWAWMLLILTLVVAVAVPLETELRQLKADDAAQRVVEAYLHDHYRIDHLVHPNDLSALHVLLYPDHAFVYLEVKAPAGGLSQQEAWRLQSALSKTLDVPVNLKVQLLLTDEFLVYPHRSEGGEVPLYGADDLIPRR
jgi:uncharacterized hydrophobic protein (TIGR00271 family)